MRNNTPEGVRGREEHFLPPLLPQPRGHLPHRGGLPHAVGPHEEQHRRAPRCGVGERDGRRAPPVVLLLRRHGAPIQHLGEEGETGVRVYPSISAGVFMRCFCFVAMAFGRGSLTRQRPLNTKKISSRKVSNCSIYV